MAEQKCLAAYEPIKIRAICGYGMRALCAILSLLVCLFETRADELPVIKDSEVIQYVGNKVEVRRLVVSVRPAHSGPHSSVSEENTPIKSSPASLRPGQKLRLTSASLRSKEKSSAARAQSNLAKASPRSTWCRQI
jgi:hypothetical protein